MVTVPTTRREKGCKQMRDRIERKQQLRDELLQTIYRATDGDPYRTVGPEELYSLEWDSEDLDNALAYLHNMGMIQRPARSTMAITREGIAYVEAIATGQQPPLSTSPGAVVFTGDFSNSILNINSTLERVNQSVNALTDADCAAKAELEQLIDELKEALEGVPESHIEEAQAVARAAEQAVKAATEEKPNKHWMEITQEGLRRAALNLATVLPIVVPTAVKIAQAIGKLG